MRYYLDTNILIPCVIGNLKELSDDAWEIVSDYKNILLTSTVCIHELLNTWVEHRSRVEIPIPYGDNRNIVKIMYETLERKGVKIVPNTKEHFMRYIEMPFYHNDPFDRLIVAQAIADRIPLISSDGLIRRYREDGLKLVYDDRSKKRKRDDKYNFFRA